MTPPKLPPARDIYLWCRLRFRERQVAIDNDEPSRFLQGWSGFIEWDDLERRPPEVLGSFSLTFVDLLGAVTERVSPWDVFDTTQGTWEVFETLFDIDSQELKNSVKELACGRGEYPLSEGILVIDRVAILPGHRGRGLGLLAMKCLIEQFRALAGVVVIKVFPLQFEAAPLSDQAGDIPRAALELDLLPRNQRAATAKLKKHYGRLGFDPVPRTEFMVLDPCRRLPDADVLLRPEPSRKPLQPAP